MRAAITDARTQAAVNLATNPSGGTTPGWRWDGTPHASTSRGHPTLLP